MAVNCPYCGNPLDSSNGSRCVRFPICTYQEMSVPSDVKEYIMYDLETTGFSDSRDKIIEIGAVYVQDGNVLDRFSLLCNPGKFVSQKITELTGISNDMLVGQISSENGVVQFVDWVKSKGVKLAIGHNIVSFDNRMLKAACKREKVAFPFSYALDTLTFAKKLKLQERGLVQNYKQETLATLYSVTYDAHRAVNDVEALSKVFTHLLADADINNIDLPITSLK